MNIEHNVQNTTKEILLPKGNTYINSKVHSFADTRSENYVMHIFVVHLHLVSAQLSMMGTKYVYHKSAIFYTFFRNLYYCTRNYHGVNDMANTCGCDKLILNMVRTMFVSNAYNVGK